MKVKVIAMHLSIISFSLHMFISITFLAYTKDLIFSFIMIYLLVAYFASQIFISGKSAKEEKYYDLAEGEIEALKAKHKSLSKTIEHKQSMPSVSDHEIGGLKRKKLKLKEGTYSTSFQSRLGFDPWLQPYTDRTIERLGKEGVKNMAIVTPAFVSDCLETLEEIAMEGEEIFHEMGGKQFTTIPCLNDDDEWVALLANWINKWSKTEVLSK